MLPSFPLRVKQALNLFSKSLPFSQSTSILLTQIQMMSSEMEGMSRNHKTIKEEKERKSGGAGREMKKHKRLEAKLMGLVLQGAKRKVA